MPFNVLLLPLLGGYVFISTWNRTRFDARRYSGHRLIFHSAIAGAVFLALAFAGKTMVAHERPDLYVTWRSWVPYPGTGTATGAFLVGVVAPRVLNLFQKREDQASAVVERWGDFLEILLLRAMNDVSQVAVTLSSGKVYIGYVTGSFDHAYDRRYMRLWPTLSGYRDPVTQEMRLTTLYAEYYETLEDEKASLAESFQVVVPISSIVSANLFDPDVFGAFERVSNGGASPGEDPRDTLSVEEGMSGD